MAPEVISVKLKADQMRSSGSHKICCQDCRHNFSCPVNLGRTIYGEIPLVKGPLPIKSLKSEQTLQFLDFEPEELHFCIAVNISLREINEN